MIKNILLILLLILANIVNAEDINDIGGDLTRRDIPGKNAIQVNAPNVVDPRRTQQAEGFGVFHKNFTRKEGLGPKFINPSCGGCHINNGKSPMANFSSITRSTMVVRISRLRLNEDGSPKYVRGFGDQLKMHHNKESKTIEAWIKWRVWNRKYPDGTKYSLRKPRVMFRINGKTQRKFRQSLRMSPALIGMGLLEAISEETILAMSDPDDLNNDGIKGRPNYVPDAKTQETRIGRFGFKAMHPTVEQQTAGAFFGDMGLTTSLFPGRRGKVESSDEDLFLNTIYQKLGGVPGERSQTPPNVVRGKEIFKEIGCDSCHKMTIVTGNDIEDPELRNQTIHPFTDLLLHDMGPRLRDGHPEFGARGKEWRTTPLWGIGYAEEIGLRPSQIVFLHAGRARSIEEAIIWHAGEALEAKRKFKNLNKDERNHLIEFLNTL